MKNLITFICLAVLPMHLFSQVTIQFRVSTVYTSVDDMDGIFSGDSDPNWELDLEDNLGIHSGSFHEEVTGNCVFTRTYNQQFFNGTYACIVPTSFSGRWRGFENDVLSTDANTGWRNISIATSSLTTRNGTWNNLTTYEAYANGDNCSSGGQVTWRISVQYRYSGTPAIPTAVLLPIANTADLCAGGSVELSGSVVNAGNWNITLSDGQTVSGSGSQVWTRSTTVQNTTNFSINNFTTSVTTCPKESTGSYTVTLPTPSGQLATNAEAATCLIKANETVHFYNRTSGNYIATVTAGPTALGSTRAVAYVENSALAVPACDNAGFITSVMARHWVIDPTTNAAGVVSLPYSQPEYTTLIAAANSNANAIDNIAMQTDVVLSKYSGGPTHINVDNLIGNNCPPPLSTGVGGTTKHTATTAAYINYIPSFSTAMFSRFSVPNFSEFWLHGGLTITPLSVNLVGFEGKCNTTGAVFECKIQDQEQVEKLILKGSIDGLTWYDLANTSVSQHINEYDFSVEDAFNYAYYQLEMVDFNGSSQNSEIIFLECQSIHDLDMKIVPNPNAGAFTAVINSTQKINELELKILDLSGKVLFESKSGFDSQKQHVASDFPLLPGIYLVLLCDPRNGQSVQEKMIVN